MNSKPVRVLLVDDEPAMRRALRTTLSASGFAIGEARNGEEAVALVARRPVALVLLDSNMPGMGGVEACRRIRALVPNAGIVMITIRDTEDDKIEALEAGADDYVTKPFLVRELIARLQAVLRRIRVETAQGAPVLRAGKLELDTERRTLRRAGEDVRLSPTEFELLRYFMQHPDIAIEHARLLRAVWGPEYGQELEYLRAYIRLLRKKIEDDPAQPQYLLTEPWLGYRFRAPSNS
ncbi:MAG: response regulator transcription factor [Bryobacteraceae bacterium]